jgi:tetratricopeptide (TPR) repeat protein
MKKLFFILLSLFSFLVADGVSNKALSSEVRTEVYAQNLLDGGYDKKADDFLIQALDSYPGNVTLLMFRGTALFNLKYLENAKKYFMLVLEKDPTNEQASNFISLIEHQEKAKKNKAVGNLIEYLNDAGLDFLMIFLAFLGGRIIDRKYDACTAHETIFVIKKFHNRQILSKNILYRMFFSLKECCFTQRRLNFCTLLEALVTLTIVIALLVVWLFLEFLFEITLFLNESIHTLTSNAIWSHTVDSFIVLGIITLILRFWMKVGLFHDKEENYIIELAEDLEKLYTEQSYGYLYETLELLSSKDYEDLKPYIHRDDARQMIANYFIK